MRLILIPFQSVLQHFHSRIVFIWARLSTCFHQLCAHGSVHVYTRFVTSSLSYLFLGLIKALPNTLRVPQLPSCKAGFCLSDDTVLLMGFLMTFCRQLFFMSQLVWYNIGSNSSAYLNLESATTTKTHINQGCQLRCFSNRIDSGGCPRLIGYKSKCFIIASINQLWLDDWSD